MTEDEQKMKNLILYRMYATDKDVADTLPIVVAVVVVIIAGVVLYNLFTT